MKKKVDYEFLRINGIAVGLYSGGKDVDALVIYGAGAPVVPDSGTLRDVRLLAAGGVNVLVPDYIGYGRSDGKFTPNNCVDTFLSLRKAITKGVLAKNTYRGIQRFLKYKRIIFLGRSFGGAFVPLLPKYDKSISKLILLFPAVDQKSQGKFKGEETNQQFMESMRKDGYHHLYRGIDKAVWRRNLENDDGLSPMDNMECLKNVRMFVAHGVKDKCIHYSKSKKYIDELIRINSGSNNQFVLKLYPNGKHGESTSILAVGDILKWIKDG